LQEPEPIRDGHVHVRERHIDNVLPQRLKGFLPICGFSDNVNLGRLE
jgi:hypothetical protein